MLILSSSFSLLSLSPRKIKDTVVSTYGCLKEEEERKENEEELTDVIHYKVSRPVHM